ncbi:hypothetical protein [Segetibacter aerophilus]|nr:hypothetical protein [Segetibacter aerophilus]
MRRNSTLLALVALISLCSCHRYYTSASFAEKASKHRTIAILPPQLVVSGSMPRNFTDYDIEQMEEKESKFFQESLYNNFLKRGNNGKYAMSVSIQPYTNTLAMLQKNSITIRDSWSKDDKELASILGVDAVVRTSIQKERFMSDVASAGIDAGKKILDAVLKKPVVLPGVTNKTNDIRATCSILSNGEALWNDSYTRESNYSFTANEIIEQITDNFAKHFPYKRKA